MKDDRLDLLIHALFEDALGDDERAELNRLLAADPDARARYRRAVAVHGALIRRSAALPAFVDDTAGVPGQRSIPWKKFAAVALIPIAIFGFGFNDLMAVRKRLPQAEVLTLTRAVWPEGSRGLAPGKLAAGTLHELASGMVEIGYPSGARVVLEGPCRFNLESKEALTVLHGRASVHAPDGAEGFRIDTPGGRFIDRGTEFGVAVGSDGRKPVVLTEVFKGEIDVRTGSASDIRLVRGESRVVADNGKLLETLDESPVRLANALHRPVSSAASPGENLAFGKPVLSPGYCIRPHGSVFPPDNLTDGRLDDSGVPGDWSFWLAPDGEDGEFTVDLITPTAVSRVSLQNTSNRTIGDRGTAGFRLFGSLDNKTFLPLTEGTLPAIDPADYDKEFPFHDFTFPAVEVRYVKLVVTAHLRHPRRPADHPCQGGGLNEIRIFER
ncbi:discoidin domain-containing protein [Luteolibacter marinus]|uniref:discoidin domain-containing protein n=1 Tax=Luteolibacter marinus TaxID=2776705 RepID=UPI0018686D17|nr:discoidin domain-containing protein [Luteolibacter marinus]